MMATARGPVLIFANGVVENTEWLRPYLDRAAAVIAADGGLRHAIALAHRPDVLIGDLDSLPPGTVPDDVAARVVRHARGKDETDLELALFYALEHFPGSEILIAGGSGGRTDHMLANILTLAHPRLRGQAVRYINDSESAWLITPDSETTIDGAPGDIVSLLPVGGPAHVVATSGLRWPLRDEWLAFGAARGISNEMTTGVAMIQLDQGAVLCVHIRL